MSVSIIRLVKNTVCPAKNGIPNRFYGHKILFLPQIEKQSINTMIELLRKI
jgi:hypothetical protein